jgi:site-specific recombinase XerD
MQAAHDITVYSRETLVQDFLAYQTYERGASKHTVSNYRNDLKKLDQFLRSDIGWQEVDRTTLRAFLQALHERGYALASIRRIVACLRSFYKFLRMEGHIERAAVDDLPRMKVPQVLPRFLEWPDVERILQMPFVVDNPRGRMFSEPYAIVITPSFNSSPLPASE